MENKEVWIVFEVNDMEYCDIPYCSKEDIEIFESEEEAFEEMMNRKIKYLSEGYNFSVEEETTNLTIFNDELNHGYFTIKILRIV